MFSVFVPWACSAAVGGFLSSDMLKAPQRYSGSCTVLPCGYLTDKGLSVCAVLDIIRLGQINMSRGTFWAES